jgi:hypothetical protein
VRALAATGIPSLATTRPNGYILNNGILNVSSLHASGITGAGVVVAVIDSGIRPDFPHISLDGSVVGCEDYVGDGLGCSNPLNDGHGTFVAGMISANVIFTLPPASEFRNAILAECPSCFIDPPANTQAPMIGTAPLAGIYALRVLSPFGGAAESTVLFAIERVIELRQRFNAGQPGGANIRVCNLSLGGATLNPGNDLFDKAIDVLLANDIVPVIAASNSGPATLTTGIPASSYSALTVGAASLAHNERILRRLQFGPEVGAQYRPFNGTQTAFFSSRGPHADGRPDPAVVSNGFANFGQGSFDTASITLGSGTSYSSPAVAGVAALLRQAFPLATARQIRRAIIRSANPHLIDDGSTELDRGAGYVDALAARNLLASGRVSDAPPEPERTNKHVKVNLERSGLNVRDGHVRDTLTNLKPGQRQDILYHVHPNVNQVIVMLTGVRPALPSSRQNQLFGDDILLAIHSAKTSSIGEAGDYPVYQFTRGGTFVINNPEQGILRVSVNGDWTNAGPVSADVTVFSLRDPLPGHTSQGKIDALETVTVSVEMPSGVRSANFRLGWREDWSNLPSNDLDLFLISPSQELIVDGVTISNPESATIPNPAPGTWLAFILGSEVNTGDDRYELRVEADGRVLRK